MSCPCGGHTMTPGVAKKKTESSVFTLIYSTCKSCGKVGLESLFESEIKLYEGGTAREIFQHVVHTGMLPDILPERFKPAPEIDEQQPDELDDQTFIPASAAVFEVAEQMSLF